MKKMNLLDQATTPDGKLMTLNERDGVYMIRIDSLELMSSRHHNSEEKIAEIACADLKGKRSPRVLIGGLGLGYTLKSALAAAPKDAAVVVAEIMPAVIAWNRVPEYGLAGVALDDRRVLVVEADVAAVMMERARAFDVIILDIDNGTGAKSVEANRDLYQDAGLYTALGALKPGGLLAVWSASDDPAFAKRMGRAGFEVKVEKVTAHVGGGGWHTLFFGRKPRAD
jgi:spermidine synthase